MGGGGFLQWSRTIRGSTTSSSSLARGADPRVCLLPTASGHADRYVAKLYSWLRGRAEAARISRCSNGDIDDLRAFCSSKTSSTSAAATPRPLPRLARPRRRRGAAARLRSGRRAGRRLAGAVCWFVATASPTRRPRPRASRGRARRFLDGSMCPHYDGEAARRPTYHSPRRRRACRPGYAADDGCALHFVDGAFREARQLPPSPDPRAPIASNAAPDGAVVETPLATRYPG